MVALASEPGALDLFWFPISILILGASLFLTRNPSKIRFLGLIVAIIGIFFVAISPFTLPKSPSSAFGQLILFLIGPYLLIILAIKISNDKMSSSNYLTSTVLTVISLSWLILIFISDPKFNHSTNKFWLVWIVSVEIIAAIIFFIQAYFEQKTVTKILYFLLGFSLLLLNEESFGIPNSSRTNLLDISTTILGTAIGILLGGLIWFYIVQKLHSIENELEMDNQLNPKERTVLIKKLNDDLNWLKKFDGDEK